MKIMYILPNCRKTGPTQQVLNIIKNLDREKIEPILITIYPEALNKESMLNEYKKYCKHICIKMSQISIIFGFCKKIKRIIQNEVPDIIHTSGVFPDYMIYKLKFTNHIMTSRNYVYDDYPLKYGRLKGFFLAKIHLKSLKNNKYTFCCSESLAQIYRNKHHISFPYIRNGVDIEKYNPVSSSEKDSLRKKLSLPKNDKLFVYSGGFVERKDQKFLLDYFSKNSKNDIKLVLLGDGDMYQSLYDMYSSNNSCIFVGRVKNVSEYLQACDYYVSSSKSEGLPNAVLEAMSVGLPVLLSDIQQHKEIFSVDEKIGYLYKISDISDFDNKIKLLINADYMEMKKHCIQSVNNNFSSSIMSNNYQRKYFEIYKEGKNE